MPFFVFILKTIGYKTINIVAYQDFSLESVLYYNNYLFERLYFLTFNYP